jgi:hypothetical protein
MSSPSDTSQKEKVMSLEDPIPVVERSSFASWKMPARRPPSSHERRVVSSFYGASDDNEGESIEVATKPLHLRQEGSAGNVSHDLDPIPIDPSACNIVRQISVSHLFVQSESKRALGEFVAMFQAGSATITRKEEKSSKMQEASHLWQEAHSEVSHGSSSNNSNSTAYFGAEPDEEESVLADSSTSAFTHFNSGPQVVPHDRWDDRFDELRHFVGIHGHCHVPTRLDSSPSLARWCKRQRYQHNLKQAGAHSTLTDEREQKLNDVDFVWDAHLSSWEERFMELVEFKQKHGHTNVPRSNGRLGSWVKSQRRQHALYIRGEKSHLKAQRVEKMKSLGFEWVGSKSPFPKESGYHENSSMHSRE